MGLDFLNPSFLLILSAAVPLGGFYYLRGKERRRRSTVLGLPLSRRYNLHNILIMAALLLTSFSLARPYSGYRDVEIKARGRDLFLVVDVSRSMLTRDIPPSRLEFTKRKIEDIADYFTAKGYGDKIGIILFAGEAYVYCPLTSDYSALRLFARSISTDLITAQGTNLAAAVEAASRSFDSSLAYRPSILLISDGEDNVTDIKKAAHTAKAAGIALNVLGVGTEEGSPIELEDGVFLKKAGGEIVISKLRQKSLKKLAELSGGKYQRATVGERDLMILFPPEKRAFEDFNGLNQALKAAHGQKIRVYNEIGPYILTGLLGVLFVLALIKPEIASAISLVFILYYPSHLRAESKAPETPGQAPPSLYRAQKLYHQGKFKEALPGFKHRIEKNPHDLKALQGLASTYYRLSDYDKAAALFRKAKEISDKGKTKFESAYNAGNSLFMKKDYSSAIKEYETALKIKKGDKKTRFNLNLARKLLELQKKQKQKEQKQRKQGKDKKNQKDRDKEQNKKQDKKQDKERGDNSQKEKKQDKKQDKNRGEEKEKGGDEEHDRDRGKEEGKKQDKKQKNEQVKHEGGIEKAPDSADIKEQEAKAWLESLPEAPALLKSKPSRKRSVNGQTW